MDNFSKKAKLEVREIVFCGGKPEKSFCDTFVYEPENVEEQSLGNLYIVGEIRNLSENSTYLLNLLASIIKKEFYSKSKRSTIESLESSLHKANSTLADYAEQGNVDWIGNLNMICGAYKNGELHISQTGGIKTLLIRDKQITDIGKDIVKEEKPHLFRTFANIASGELEINDLLLFATPEFFNEFSLEKIRQLSSSLKFDEFADTIQRSIENESGAIAVSALAMKIKEEKSDYIKMVSPLPQKQLLPEKELEGALLSKQEDGGKFEIDRKIEPILIAENKTEKIRLEDIIEECEKENNRKTEEAEREVQRKGKLKPELEEIAKEEKLETLSEKGVKETKVETNFKTYFNKIRHSADYILRVSFSLFGKIKIILEGAKGKFSDIAFFFSRKTASSFESENILGSGKKNNIQLLPGGNLTAKKNKILLVIFVLFVLALIGNLAFLNYQKKQEEELKFYQNIISQAKNKLDLAEVALINNKVEARRLLSEAGNLVLEIKNNYPKMKKEAETVLSQAQRQVDAVDAVVRLESFKSIADLSEKMDQPKNILEIKGKNYILDSKDNSLYQLDLGSGELSKIQNKPAGDIGNLKFSISFSKLGEAAFITEANKMTVFDANAGEWKTANFSFSEGIKSITDADSFSNNLYLLDGDSNQIYKYQKVLDNFTNAKEWLVKSGDEQTDIRNAISFAIDGNIYILKSDGKVEKYNLGKKQDFSIENPSDQISDSAQIYTAPDLKYIYITEPGKKRILVFNKAKGELVRQFISEEFGDLKNIIIDSREEKIYALSGRKVLEVEISANKN